MARESTITAEQVNAVADAIKAEGGKPTSRAVRERLGNTGSMGTINRLLQQWKGSHERRAASALVLPASLQNSILDFMEQALAAERAGLEAELDLQQREAADLAVENERQAETIEKLDEQIVILNGERAAAEGKATQLAKDLEAAHAEANAERQAAEHARTELAKAQLRLEAMPRLEADLETARAETASERTARIEAERAAAVLQAQKDDLQSRLGASAAALDAQRRDHTEFKTSADAELARLRDELGKLKASADVELARVREEAGTAMQQQRSESAAALALARSESAERLEESRAELKRALEMTDQHQRTIATLNDALNAATTEARRAAEEAAELRGRHGAETAGQSDKSTKKERTKG